MQDGGETPLRRSMETGDSTARNTYLRVPTPPASSRNAGPSWSALPTQRMANARRMWPWATISTSPGVVFSEPDPFMTGACHFVRISAIRRSMRSVTSCGLLFHWSRRSGFSHNHMPPGTMRQESGSGRDIRTLPQGNRLSIYPSIPRFPAPCAGGGSRPM